MKLLVVDTKFLNIILSKDVVTHTNERVTLKKGNYFFILFDIEQKKYTLKNFTVYKDETFTIFVTE